MRTGMKIKVFYDDGTGVKWKEGTVTFCDDTFIVLDNDDGIPISRIIRFEVLE